MTWNVPHSCGDVNYGVFRHFIVCKSVPVVQQAFLSMGVLGGVCMFVFIFSCLGVCVCMCLYSRESLCAWMCVCVSVYLCV